MLLASAAGQAPAAALLLPPLGNANAKLGIFGIEAANAAAAGAAAVECGTAGGDGEGEDGVSIPHLVKKSEL